DWAGVRKEACRRVEMVASRQPDSEDRLRVVGVGASGDKTLVIDRDAESAAIETLLQAGDVRIVSEERGEVGSRSSRWTVLLDTIDGSANFEKAIPFYCTSLAVTEGERLSKTKHALVRNLVSGDVYYAEVGVGAEKNGKKITSSAVAELQDSVAAIDLSKAPRGVVEKLVPLVISVKRQLHLGANEHELCLLAEGKVDLFVDLRGRLRTPDLQEQTDNAD